MKDINQTMKQHEIRIQDMEAHIYDLQTAAAFHNESIESLEKTIATQHGEIQYLQKQIKILSEHIKSLKDEAVKDIRDETPPPHY